MATVTAITDTPNRVSKNALISAGSRMLRGGLRTMMDCAGTGA